jgi:S-adenosylmethionine:tRNA ribosyltransferase-isomerase
VREVEKDVWISLIKPSKRVKAGIVLKISDELSVEVLEKDDDKWRVHLIYNGNIFEILDKVGNIPLPPYIERKMTNEEYKNLDFDRYQTVFAEKEGAVAAPTAGLHFTKEILEKLEKQGIQHCFVTLNVGLGTFKPVKCENILDHKMDSELFEITQNSADMINKAKKDGKNIVAVGTTSVRTLETVMNKYGKIIPVKDSSELFIYPSYEFKIVDKLITNFHLPKSTLLMLVSAFATKDFIFKAYEEAIKNKYRFYSYGDCMFIR